MRTKDAYSDVWEKQVLALKKQGLMLIVAIIHDVFLKIQGEDVRIAYTGYDGEMLR